MRTKSGAFRKEDYKKYNEYAINLITKYLVKKGFTVPDKEEDYGIDMIAYKDGEEYRIEAEVKRSYYGHFTFEETYPYKTVSFLGRKKRLAKKGKFWYFIICEDSEYCVICDSDTIYNEKYKLMVDVDNDKRFGRDEFYRVPRELCAFRNLNE